MQVASSGLKISFIGAFDPPAFIICMNRMPLIGSKAPVASDSPLAALACHRRLCRIAEARPDAVQGY